MPTTIDFGSIALVANQVPVFMPSANGQNVPPGLNFQWIEVHIGLTQIPDGTYLKWEVDWSTQTGNSTNWNHTGGFAGFLPTTKKDGTVATEGVVEFGIPLGVRRGRFHVVEVTQNSTVSVSVVAFP